MTRTSDRETHRRHELSPCEGCGTAVRPGDLRDLPSAKEYHIVGLCQRCQDALYLAEPQHRPGPPLPLHAGVVVAALPFIFVAAEARIAWEPRLLLRAGLSLEPLDRHHELTPMREPWDRHLLRSTELDALDHPALRERLETADLVVGLDRAALDAVRTGCRVAPHVPLASLEHAVPWRALYGRALMPFDRLVRHLRLDPERPPDAAPPSVLRQSALIAATLELPPARTPFRCLLDAHRARLGAAPAPPRSAR